MKNLNLKNNVFALGIVMSSLSPMLAQAEISPTTYEVGKFAAQALNETRQDLLTKQGLLNAPLGIDRLLGLEERGYDYAYTLTGAVIDLIGGELICILDGRYKINDASYDEQTDTMLTDFKLDESQSNVICQDFTAGASEASCSIRHGAKRVGYSGGNVSVFQSMCVEQLVDVVTAS